MKRSYAGLHGAMAWCNLTLTATTIYIYLGIPLMMREQGWSGTEIGLFQASGLPVILKFLLASSMDKFRFRQANYLSWAGLLGVAFVLCLLLFARLSINEAEFLSLFLIALLMTLVTTGLDVPINAFVINRLPESERAKSGVIRSAATALASVMGGGLMLLVYARWGWQWPFYSLLMMALVGALLMYWSHTQYLEEYSTEQAMMPKASLFGMWKSYFQRPNMGWWNVILMLHFPFIGAAWLYLKPTMLDLGVTVEHIAWLSAVAGLVAALASFLYSQNIHRLSPYRALWLFSLVNIVALCGMSLAFASTWTDWRLIVAVLLVAIALGLSSGVLFGLIMYHSRPQVSASDYGVQTSLFSLSRLLIPIGAGVMLDHAGYSSMYIGLALGACLVSLLCLYATSGSRLTLLTPIGR